MPSSLGPDDVNFEVELGVLFSKKIPINSTLTQESLTNFIEGYFLLLDYTDKKALVRDATSGGPFTESKCQDNFLVLSEFVERDKIEDHHDVMLELKIDGEVK